MNNQPCYNTLAAIKTFLTELPPAGATTYSTIMLGKILLESVIDATPVVIALLNEAEQVILGNQKYQKLTTEFAGHEPATLLLAVIKENLGEQWLHFRQEQGYFSEQEVRIDPGGYHYPHWFICSGTWFRETGTTNTTAIDTPYYLLLVANDVTLLKRQQEEIRLNALRALLAEEELTEGLRETLAGAIHQLELPMNLMVAALNRLQQRAKTSGTEDSLCSILQETIANSHEALNHLSQGMSVSDSQKEIATPVNLNELIHEVLTIFTYRLLAAGIVVDWQPALVLPSLLGHAKRLRNMFKQLIDNAIDAMKSNRQQRELHILTCSDAEVITITIEDTGCGIADELRLRVFEPFFTTKKAEKRTGMGLATVQEVVNLHAGTIYIDPDYTPGSRFILHFPRAHYRDN